MFTRTLLALSLMTLISACDGSGLPAAPVDSGAEVASCTVTPIASVTGRCNSYPMPLTLVEPADVEHMTVYVDGVALAPSDWSTNGHAVTITSCVEGDSAQRLVAVSFGCI